MTNFVGVGFLAELNGLNEGSPGLVGQGRSPRASLPSTLSITASRSAALSIHEMGPAPFELAGCSCALAGAIGAAGAASLRQTDTVSGMGVNAIRCKMRHFVRLAQFTAWAAIAVIAYLSLTWVGVVYSIYYKLSPFLNAHFVHFTAFALVGVIFCIAYQRRIFFVCGVVFGTAIALELLQTLTPDRHGTLVDALDKLAGGAGGILIAGAGLTIWQRTGRSMSKVCHRHGSR
jgi:hypothetical protein